MFECIGLTEEEILQVRALFKLKGYKYLFISSSNKFKKVKVEIYLKYANKSDLRAKAFEELKDAQRFVNVLFSPTN